MSCPEAFPAFAISVGWPTAPAEICFLSAVSCSTSRHPPPMLPPTSRLPGSAPSAKDPCTSSNDSPRPRSSSPKPDWHVPMTPPDRLPNPATRPCLWPGSAELCLEGQQRPFCGCNHCHPMTAHACGCTLSTLVVLSCPAPQHQLPLSMPLKTHKLKHPARPHQRLPSHGSIRTAPGRGSLRLRDSSCRSSSDRVLTYTGRERTHS